MNGAAKNEKQERQGKMGCKKWKIITLLFCFLKENYTLIKTQKFKHT
jgi:hypothetical protein